MTMKGHAFYIVCGFAALYACGDDDAPTRLRPVGGEAGQPAGGASPEAGAGGALSAQAGDGSAGESSLPGGAGATSTLMGGAPSSPGGGQGPANDAGMPAVQSGGAGGMAGEHSGEEKLSLCGRLNQRPVLSSRSALTFDSAVYRDLCVGWTTKLYEVELAQEDYLNRLASFNLGFWGCRDTGVEAFALLWKQPEVFTAGDAMRLIDYYVLVLNFELDSLSQLTLSSSEETEMRAALARLSASMVTDPTLDYSHPECVNPPTGEGGAGGEGGGASGEGGQVALGGAGQGGL